jgi:hypothetical protein
MPDPLRIVVSGMIAGDPHQGGAVWAVLQYVLGLRALGHDVFLVEPIAATALRPAGGSLASSVNAAFFRDTVNAFGLGEHAALLRQDTRETVGLGFSALLEAASGCDLLINISGMLTDFRILEVIPRRLYLDLDPAFNQLWHAVDGIDMRFDAHTHFATVGLAIGAPGCEVPTCGRTWLPTLQPVVLSEWPTAPDCPDAAWTTLGNWRGYGSIHHRGVLYGQKAHSFRRLIELPRRTRARIRVALAIHPGEVNDLEALRVHGWEVDDPIRSAGTPGAYRDFIGRSKGELGIAKSGYVEAQCGWFSDRSVCYLASGRPVVAQDTGFGRFLPTGDGLLAFRTVEEAVGAIDTVEADYPTHRRRARDIAEEYFRAERVLDRLLDLVGACNDTEKASQHIAGRRHVEASAAATGSLG